MYMYMYFYIALYLVAYVRSMETMQVWYAKFDICHTKFDMLYAMFLYLCQLY